jgi:hypothetical protein
MTCGSGFGAVSWGARMTNLACSYCAAAQAASSALPSTPEGWSLYARAYNFRAAFTVTYAVEFLCLSAANLMVLDRMSDFAASQVHGMRKRWAAAGRAVMVAVVLGNAVGLAANAAAAVHFEKAAKAASTASFDYASNTSSTQELLISARTFMDDLSHASLIASAQSFCEVCVLLLIVAAFIVTGLLCARRFKSTLLTVDAASKAAAAGKRLRLQSLGTTGFVFVAFLLWSVFSTMYAVAYQLQDLGRTQCAPPASLCDSSCHNVYTHIVN